MKTLVVFYSRTGRTRKLAQAIARAGDCDLEELVDTQDRRGAWGYLRSGVDALLGRLTRLQSTARKPIDYDLVIVGTPVWNASLSSPVRTWLVENRDSLPAVAWFLTHGGTGSRRVLEQMEGAAGKRPLDALEVKEEAIERGSHLEPARRFVAGLAETIGRLRPPEPVPPLPPEPPPATF